MRSRNGETWLRRLVRRILFPRVGCAYCGREKAVDGLCDHCRERLEAVEEPRCIKCGKHLPENMICPDCREISPMYTEASAPYYYTGLLKHMILELKYHNKRWYAEPIGRIVAREYLAKRWRVDYAVPVPMHHGKLKSRHYSQTELIAQAFSEATSVPIRTDVMIKKRETTSQANLSRRERMNNLLDSFCVMKPGDVYKKRILLIDDTLTTGATVAECAKLLTLCGAERVYVLCAACGKRNDKKEQKI